MKDRLLLLPIARYWKFKEACLPISQTALCNVGTLKEKSSLCYSRLSTLSVHVTTPPEAIVYTCARDLERSTKFICIRDDGYRNVKGNPFGKLRKLPTKTSTQESFDQFKLRTFA